jgi:hypothetical protein
MKITNVKLMTTEEVANFKTKVYGSGSEKKQLSSDYCAKNINDIIQKHKDYKDIHLKNAYEKSIIWNLLNNEKIIENNKIVNDVKNGIKHFCVCGSELRYVNNFNFVGCSNWNNQSEKHISYNERTINKIIEYDDFINTYEFPALYLNDFKNYYNLNFIMVSILQEYLFQVYKQECYSERLNFNTYQKVSNSQRESKKQELIIKSICLNKFKKVVDQLHFSLKIDNKFSVRIFDLVCSNDDYIYILEIKKHKDLQDVLKLNLYQDILKQYLTQINDTRPVKSYTIVYEGEGDLSSNCLTIKDLENEF